MRSIVTLFAVLLLSGLASAQAGFGHAHPNWTPPGIYSEPFEPLVTTPFVALDSVSTPSLPLDPVAPAAEARNAMAGNEVVYTQPTWYGSMANPEVQEKVISPDYEASRPGAGFNSGAARFESDYGAAQLRHRPTAGQARLYTNPDVERVNQTNGLVKYSGKTEHLD
jgi:hypothetical protein